MRLWKYLGDGVWMTHDEKGPLYYRNEGPTGIALCTAHATETPEERQRKLDEARKRVQQAQMAQQMQAANQPASAMPPHVFCHDCATPVRLIDVDWIGARGFCATCSANHPPSAKPPLGQAASGMDAANPLPHWGNWPNIVQTPQHVSGQATSDPGGTHGGISPDFGAQVSGQLAQQRGIDKAAANDRMRVPTFEEKESERARVADYIRKNGVL